MTSNLLATWTARLDGAPTEATIAMPPMRAFCKSSKLARPESKSRDSRSGVRSSRNSAKQLIDGVVSAYVLAHREQIAGDIEESRAVKAPSAVKHALRLAKPRRQQIEDFSADGEIIVPARRTNCLQRQQ